MIWRTVKTPKEYKKQARVVFREAIGEKLWKFLEEKEANMKTYKRAPDDSTQWKCLWIDCFHGMGLAGAGMCSARGDWTNPKCPEYISNDDYEAQQEVRTARG